MTDADPAQSEKTKRPLPGFMPDRLPENAPAPDFDPKSLAKDLLRSTRAGSLATIDRNTGHPFASLVNVATDSDGAPLILISRLATHTANLETDSRASVLLAATGKGDPLAHPRLTLLGSFVRVPREDTKSRGCAAVSSPGIRNRSFTPALPISRSGGSMRCPPISMAALPAPPI